MASCRDSSSKSSSQSCQGKLKVFLIEFFMLELRGFSPTKRNLVSVHCNTDILLSDCACCLEIIFFLDICARDFGLLCLTNKEA